MCCENIENKPQPEDYFIPKNEEEMEDMIEKMMACGMCHELATKTIKDRTTAYNKAVREHANKNKPNKVTARKPYATKQSVYTSNPKTTKK